MAVRMLTFVFSRSRSFDGGAGIGIDRSDGLLLFRRPRLSIGLSRTIAAGRPMSIININYKLSRKMSMIS